MDIYVYAEKKGAIKVTLSCAHECHELAPGSPALWEWISDDPAFDADYICANTRSGAIIAMAREIVECNMVMSAASDIFMMFLFIRDCITAGVADHAIAWHLDNKPKCREDIPAHILKSMEGMYS